MGGNVHIDVFTEKLDRFPVCLDLCICILEGSFSPVSNHDLNLSIKVTDMQTTSTLLDIPIEGCNKSAILKSLDAKDHQSIL